MHLGMAQKSCPGVIFLQEVNAQCPHKNLNITVCSGSAIIAEALQRGRNEVQHNATYLPLFIIRNEVLILRINWVTLKG